jgi:APA family basic amino acid/polyamine antiporter
VLLAMGRRGDVPRVFARVDGRGSPVAAVIGVGCAIAALALIGDVKLTWSFSAFTVLVYYAITNLAAIRMPRSERRFPVWVAWAGLLACLSLAFFVEVRVWAMGLGLIGVGFAGRAVVKRLQR